MSLRLINADLTKNQGKVIIASDDMEELQDTAAVEFALKEAEKAGISRPGQSGFSAPYPVDAAGNEMKDFSPDFVAVEYRRDVRIQGSL